MGSFNYQDFQNYCRGKNFNTAINDKVEYSINREEGKVTAYIKNSRYYLIELMLNTQIISEEELYYKYPTDAFFKRAIDCCILENRYVGRARVSPEDTWNEKIGKTIARERCLYKYYKALSKAAEKFFDIYIDLNLERFDKLWMHCKDQELKFDPNFIDF